MKTPFLDSEAPWAPGTLGDSPGDPTPKRSPDEPRAGKIHFHESRFLPRHSPGPGPVFNPGVTAKLRAEAFKVGKYSLVRLPNGCLHVWDGVRGACPDEHRLEGMLEALIYNHQAAIKKQTP